MKSINIYGCIITAKQMLPWCCLAEIHRSLQVGL